MAPKAVPELLVKKRKRDEQWAAERAAAAVDSRKKARATRKIIFKKAEKYVKEYRDKVQLRPVSRWRRERATAESERRNGHHRATSRRLSRRSADGRSGPHTPHSMFLIAAVIYNRWTHAALPRIHTGAGRDQAEARGQVQGRLLRRAGGEADVRDPHPRSEPRRAQGAFRRRPTEGTCCPFRRVVCRPPDTAASAPFLSEHRPRRSCSCCVCARSTTRSSCG